MTTLTTTYSFMDLLKDYNYVPETDHSENFFLLTIKSAYNRLADLVRTNDYNFMDLLKDNDYVPEIAEDNTSIILEIENGFNSLADFIEFNTSDYNFIDLLKDKGHVPGTVVTLPVASNDNEIILRQAS